MKTKKNRSVITSRYQPVARLDLCYVSENEGKLLRAETHFWEGSTAAATEEEFSEDLHPPIPSHPGMKYPVRASPSLRLWKLKHHEVRPT